ncbi:hypothetical protein BOX15_Mlig002137g3 [Macrostomum lignano]|uniref:PDZ domain-containing protein n=1 Tax=Macrostomum lignano TaxID=282301 RepID=A0A267H706_9PLAT|nr:hypothetical protein BOX15_Mlig002137g3 [Macrostomum lignano]
MYKCFPFLKACSGQADSLDKRHASLQSVPEDVFRNGRTLEECMLDSNQIKELPKKIFAITQLKRLTLSDNSLTRIPPNIGNLTALLELDVSRNEITDFPENIKFCSDLRMLDMSSNPIQGLPPGLCQLKNLTQLNLNDITLGELPPDFGNLNALRRLELRDNLLKSLPPSFGALQCLEFLDLGGNEFADLPPLIGQLRSLAELFLDANELKTLPPQIGSLKCLFQLDVSENFLEFLPDEFCCLAALTDLTLTQNNLDAVPEGFGNLRRLSMLKLDSNRLVSVTSQIGYCTNLEEIYLTDNLLSTLPPTIGNLTRLINLNVDRNRLASLVPDLGRCRSLNILSLRDNRLTSLPAELGQLSQLHVLDVAGNKLDRLPVSITACPLKALWLSDKQSQPIVNLQTDEDPTTGEQFLTCYMLPQEGFVPGEEPPSYAQIGGFYPPSAQPPSALPPVAAVLPPHPAGMTAAGSDFSAAAGAAVQPRHPPGPAGGQQPPHDSSSYAAELRMSANRDSANLRLKHHPRFDRRNVDGPVIHHKAADGGKELSFAPRRVSPAPEEKAAGGDDHDSSSDSGSDSESSDGEEEIHRQQPSAPAPVQAVAAPTAAKRTSTTAVQQQRKSPPPPPPPPAPTAGASDSEDSESLSGSGSDSESESDSDDGQKAPTVPAVSASSQPQPIRASQPVPPPIPPPPYATIANPAATIASPPDAAGNQRPSGSQSDDEESSSSSSGSSSTEDGSESESEAGPPPQPRPPTPPQAPASAPKQRRPTEEDMSSGGEEIEELRRVGFSDETQDNECKTPSLKRRDTPHYNKNARISKNQDPQYVIQVIEKYSGTGPDPADAMVVLPSNDVQQPEVIRASPAKPPLPGLQRQQHLIVIDRQPGVSLGISIAGGLGSSPWRPGDHSIFMSKVAEAKPAYLAGLRPGDRLLAVNERSMVGAEHNAAVEAMKRCGNQMRLLVEREVPAADDDQLLPTAASTPASGGVAGQPQQPPPPLPSLGALPDVERVKGIPDLNAQMQLRTQPFSVTLTRDPARGGGGLGFSIAGGRGSLPRGGAAGEGDENIYISRVTPNGAADAAKLQVGDRIVKINGADVTQCSHEEAVALLTANSTGASVTMDLVRELVFPKPAPPPPSNGSSAAHSDASDSPFPVEEITLALDDGSTGQPQQMGLSICGGCDYASHPFGTTEPGVFVSRIVPGGAASRTNLRVGDRILAVNGRDLRQAAHHEAVSALKENRYRFKLRVRHDPPPAGMRTLTIHRVDKTKKLGITITGGVGSPPANPADPTDEGIFVSRLTPGGVFSEDGRIKPGMRLLEVNGRTLLGVSRQEAASILRDLPAEIRVVICDGFPAEPAGKQQPQARPRQDPSRPRLESTTSIDRDEEVENLKGLQAHFV